MKVKQFKKTVEDFTCFNCGAKVKGSGYTNHCPNCLWSCHVDNYPGDRQASCHGLMKPIGLIVLGKKQILVHRCIKCHKTIKNKVCLADNKIEIIQLSRKVLANIK